MSPRLILPERINRLEELANNLWWSWNPQARNLFRALDYPQWRLSGHNPVKQLRELSPASLQSAVSDPAFLALYDSVISSLDAYLSEPKTWFATNYPSLLSGPVAYFSMEFALHSSLPIYAGGLGVLAGDLIKEASDLGLPMVAVGFMYPQGYFQQRISADGWQEEIYRQLDFAEAPISPSVWPQGNGPLVSVQLGDRPLYVKVWQVRLGRVTLFLLDTNVEENSLSDRQLAAQLYTADRERRLQQELVLGIGGVRVLRELGIKPSIWHANEGHTAFMMLERVREEVEKGVTFPKALESVRATTVFTTHTPVPAGHDVFPIDLVAGYLNNYAISLGINPAMFLQLGQENGTSTQSFNMTVLALKMSNHCNAVSQLHGKVTRRMWRVLWPGLSEDEVPISHVTNGIHTPTWIAREMGEVYEKYLGRDWRERVDDTRLWQRVTDIPDEELWSVRRLLKRKLISTILEQARERWGGGKATSQQVLEIGALLDSDTLTIGFVRRFTEYKRPALFFHDIERLKRIITNRWHPVQIIFAGKSHPADFLSKTILHRVYTLAMDHGFQGRIAFVEDYNMHIAHYLVQGVDVWLNAPRRLQEASGTSGMKATLNGVPQASIPDGWWHEAYNGSNGWVIGDDRQKASPEDEDNADAEALYRLLEDNIVPLYYERDRNGVPHSWIHLVKEAIASIAPVFSARRMLKEYTDKLYLPATRHISTKAK